MHVIAVELDIKPEKRDRYLAEIKRHAPQTRKDESGCLQFDASIDQADPNVFVLYEVYASDAALDHHRKSPSLKLYMETTGDLVAARNPHFALRRASRTAAATPGARMPVLLVTLKIRPERLDEYLQLLTREIEEVMTEEEGCVQFDVSIDKSEPATLYLYEVWASEAALGKHRGGAVQKRFFEATTGMVADRSRRAAFKLL